MRAFLKTLGDQAYYTPQLATPPLKEENSSVKGRQRNTLRAGQLSRQGQVIA